MFRFYAVFRDGTVPIPLLPNRFNIFIATELSLINLSTEKVQFSIVYTILNVG